MWTWILSRIQCVQPEFNVFMKRKQALEVKNTKQYIHDAHWWSNQID